MFIKVLSRNYYPLHVSAQLHAMHEGIVQGDFFWRQNLFAAIRYKSKLVTFFTNTDSDVVDTNFTKLLETPEKLLDIFNIIATDIETATQLTPGKSTDDVLKLYTEFRINITRMIMGYFVVNMFKEFLSVQGYKISDDDYTGLLHPYRLTKIPAESLAIYEAHQCVIKGADIEVEAEKLAVSFGWIHSEYRGVSWGTEEYKSELQREVKKPNLAKHEISFELPDVIVDLAGKIAFVFDEGKSALVRANWALRETLAFLGEDEKKLLSATDEEFVSWAHNKFIPTQDMVDRSKDGYAVIIENNSVTHYFGAKDTQDLIKEKNIESPFTEVKHQSEIKGRVAFAGVVKGRVKVLFDQKDANRLEEGDILVASMTTPELIGAMRKASAFVTDEGGIMCHAAIIARELKIPCVTGTKVATKTLKDGDLIEVDADKGIVKILKRAK